MERQHAEGGEERNCLEISKKWETSNLAVAERMQGRATCDLGVKRTADGSVPQVKGQYSENVSCACYVPGDWAPKEFKACLLALKELQFLSGD